MKEKKDITNRNDIENLIRIFYEKLLSDESLSYIFTDVAKIELEPHILLISDFWENLIFGSDTYRRNAMQPHLELNKQTPLKKEHFDAWLAHFKNSVDELFAGEKAHFAKNRAQSIAMVMQVKILNPESKL
ncbi:MAG: group III truncated hemoglobin [Calditrichaeota bacterium]|nr:MAG: group III truncated hemoglobin [Calditrichota bacterium]MBL1204774.1 group III truncated hemoglobin [Calditrichota bacterium]NOG44603.1 group III truncated hemoglobin [Calditrichota bacterium]